MVLNFLDPNKRVTQDVIVKNENNTYDSKQEVLTYSVALYGQVINDSLQEIIDEWQHDDQTSILDIYKHFYNIYFNEVLYNNSLNIEDAALQEAKIYLQKAMEELQVKSAEELTNKTLEFTAELVNFIVFNHDLPLPVCISNFFDKFSTKWPVAIENIRLSMCMGTFIIPLFLCGQNLLNWNKLTNQQRVEYITECCVSGINIFNTSISIKSLRTLSSATASIEEKINAALRLKFNGTDMKVIKNISQSSGRTIDEALIGTGRYRADTVSVDGMDVEISKWTKFSRVSAVVVRIMNILMLGVALVLLSIDIHKEFKDKYMWDSIKAIDIIQAICIGVSIVCEIISFVLDCFSIACSFIPIIGTIAVIIGLVFTIVSIILHSKYEPKTSVEIFIEAEIVPFVNTLEAPTAEWLADTKKKIVA